MQESTVVSHPRFPFGAMLTIAKKRRIRITNYESMWRSVGRQTGGAREFLADPTISGRATGAPGLLERIITGASGHVPSYYYSAPLLARFRRSSANSGWPLFARIYRRDASSFTFRSLRFNAAPSCGPSSLLTSDFAFFSATSVSLRSWCRRC